MTRTLPLFALACALTGWMIFHESVDADQRSQSGVTRPAADVLLAQAEPKPKTRKAPAGRVPSGWAKIGLSAEQKKNIYEIQAKYKEQTEALEKQIEDLKVQRDMELEEVLTPEQKQKLKSQSKSKDTDNSGADEEVSPKSNDK